MSRYNNYFANGFRACRLLAYARDNHRNRDVRIYAMPGEFSVVGVTDDTDCWIAPVSADPFSVNITRLMKDLGEGKPLPPPKPPGESGRVRKSLVTDNPSPTRRKLLEQPTPAKRNRHVLSA